MHMAAAIVDSFDSIITRPFMLYTSRTLIHSCSMCTVLFNDVWFRMIAPIITIVLCIFIFSHALTLSRKSCQHHGDGDNVES